MLKWKRLSFFRITTELNNQTYIVGKDYGTFGNKAYYYIELDGKVISHGHIRQRDAKRYVVNKLNESKLQCGTCHGTNPMMCKPDCF